MNKRIINSYEEEIHYELFVYGDIDGYKYFYDILTKPMIAYAFDVTRSPWESNMIVTDIFILAWKLHEKMESASQIRDFIRQGVEWRSKAYLETKIVKLVSSALEEHEKFISDMFERWKWRNFNPGISKG
ncbi:hypothetical protein [Chitinophaga barathri]|uniref:Uncharacterized protein n=1 Tax=Chitinophaga barathri TaxID=1647451 RepID=A0A3N4MYU5_9BACT|nr:hypothetical protein [Chitinophaga barathri]RPD40593.1 hypothetical protein EG028_14945 [Chitinophaga barathri]